MSGIKLQKRDHDFFVSYGHGDLARVAPLVELLKRRCGLRVWFDDSQGNAASRSSELLGGAIRNSRGALFCLSEAWKKSTWCKNEYEVALAEQRIHAGFEVVSVRLDDVDPPAWLNVAEILDLRRPDAGAICRLLCSLSSEVPHRFDNAEDVYLAAPWSRPSSLALATFEVLRGAGWRLVGDSPDLKHLGERRIEAIQRTTRGVVALLPHEPGSGESATSPYILQEAALAIQLGEPLLLLAEPGVAPPAALVEKAFRSTAFPLAAGSEGPAALAAVLEGFDDELHHRAHDDSRAFIFLASSLREESGETDGLVNVIQRASNMLCVRGERVGGDNVQLAIIDLIRRAAVVIADVSDDKRNTLIETGVAMGSSTRLKLMCREPPDGAPLKKRFMFEGQEYFWYRTAEERLALCYYFARQFRRRVYVVG